MVIGLLLATGMVLCACGFLSLLIDNRASVHRAGAVKEVLASAKISRDFHEAIKNSPPPVYRKSATMVPEMREPPLFCNQDIEDFYQQLVGNNPLIRRPAWAVICRILELLDKLGGCPSVVSDPDKLTLEGDINADAIDLLAHIPLWQHSLAVATKMLHSAKYEVFAGDYLIVALAHDIGKIPNFHIDGYSTSSHPHIAMSYLSGIPEFAGLPNSAELLTSVRDHHSLVKKFSLAAKLKEADHDVRMNELARQFRALEASERHADQDSCLIRHTLARGQKSVERDPKLSHFGRLFDSKPLLVDISGWFNAEKVIDVIKKNVNLVFGGWWNAVSTPDGYIFCSSKGLFKLLNRAFPRQPNLLAAYTNDIAQQDILFSVVMHLARDYDAVATELLGNREYLCPVTITTSSDKAKLDHYMLVPLRAEALGLSSKRLEAEKSQTILRMVKSIVPLKQDPEATK